MKSFLFSFGTFLDIIYLISSIWTSSEHRTTICFEWKLVFLIIYIFTNKLVSELQTNYLFSSLWNYKKLIESDLIAVSGCSILWSIDFMAFRLFYFDLQISSFTNLISNIRFFAILWLFFCTIFCNKKSTIIARKCRKCRKYFKFPIGTKLSLVFSNSTNLLSISNVAVSNSCHLKKIIFSWTARS
jgi:hypothetical protein